MNENNKMVSIGDLTIDLNAIQSIEDSLSVTYKSELSGSSALVSAIVGAFGSDSHCIGKVGEDDLGVQVMKSLQFFNVSCDNVEMVPKKRTALTLNSDNNGGKNTISYRKDSAGTALKPDDIHPHFFEKGDVLFYSSDVMIENSSRSALEKALKLANYGGTMIVYAPLIRYADWINTKIARETIMQTLPHTHFLILTDEELQFLTEISEEHLAVKKLFTGKMKGLIILKSAQRLTYVTTDDKGRLNLNEEEMADSAIAKEVFIGSFISQWLEKGYHLENIQGILAEPDQLENVFLEALKYAHGAGKIIGSQATLEVIKNLE